MKKLGFSTLFVLSLTLFAGAHAWCELYKDRIAAVVNGDVILISDIELHKKPLIRSAAALPLGIIPPGKWPTEKEILDELIVTKLLDQEAGRKGSDIEEKALDASIAMMYKRNNLSRDQFVLYLAANGLSYDEFRKIMKQRYRLSKLISAEVEHKVPLSEEDAHIYFKEHRSEIDKKFKELMEGLTPARPPAEREERQLPTHQEMYEGGRIRLRRITLNIPTGATKKVQEQLMAKARQIYEAAVTGADFAQLAKKHSQDPWASSGGDLGFMNYKDMVPMLQQVTRTMKKGDISQPLVSAQGIMILSVADAVGRTVKKVPIPDEVRREWEKRLKEANERQAAQQGSPGNETGENRPEGKGSSDDEKADSSKEKTEKSLGILTPEQEKEYRKVRDKVVTLLKSEKARARMKEWIDGLKKNAIIETRL